MVKRRGFCQRITNLGTFKCTLLLRKYLIIFRPYQHEWLILFISKRDVCFLNQKYDDLQKTEMLLVSFLICVVLRCPYDVSLKRKGCLVNLFYDGKQEKEANIKISNMWRKTNPMNIYLQNSLSRIRISEVLYNMRSFFWTCIPAL